MDSSNNNKVVATPVSKSPSRVPPPPPPRTPDVKLDLKQITNHPLVVNRSPEAGANIEQTVLRSRANSQVFQRSPLGNTFGQHHQHHQQVADSRRQVLLEQQSPANKWSSLPASPQVVSGPPVTIGTSGANFGTPKRTVSELTARIQRTSPSSPPPPPPPRTAVANLGHLLSITKTSSTGKPPRDVATSPSANDGNNNISSSNNNNNNINYASKIRRSTSLSYTSTLRRKNIRDPAELPSPQPNVRLPNFSISPYSSSNGTIRE